MSARQAAVAGPLKTHGGPFSHASAPSVLYGETTVMEASPRTAGAGQGIPEASWHGRGDGAHGFHAPPILRVSRRRGKHLGRLRRRNGRPTSRFSRNWQHQLRMPPDSRAPDNVDQDRTVPQGPPFLGRFKQHIFCCSFKYKIVCARVQDLRANSGHNSVGRLPRGWSRYCVKPSTRGRHSLVRAHGTQMKRKISTAVQSSHTGWYETPAGLAGRRSSCRAYLNGPEACTARQLGRPQKRYNRAAPQHRAAIECLHRTLPLAGKNTVL